jgi:hypothetical protein
MFHCDRLRAHVASFVAGTMSLDRDMCPIVFYAKKKTMKNEFKK